MSTRSRLARLCVLVPLVGLGLAGCGASGSQDAGSSASGSASASASKDGQCTYTPTQNGEVARKVDLPPSTPVATGDVAVTIQTNFGTLKATLDAKNAPCAVNSFLSLAKQGYYDKTPCHRITSDSRGFHVLQCGDPTGTGTGTPGYAFAEELTGQEDYKIGSLALANTGQADTSGGQFFIDYDTTQLPKDYTQFGQLDAASIKLVQAEAKKATKGEADGYDGKPVVSVELVKVTQG
ncbi:peptidylprolyl isomerase [Nocardioides mangrovicus]|uniref:peptidylprolyl isomerase n=1 Tax=Nocardioides mangrovicus TaxID=2478913 RepID=UPI00131431DC|nr:peptidylprolyl isomerase [Nocardioides mangrovicus]